MDDRPDQGAGREGAGGAVRDGAGNDRAAPRWSREQFIPLRKAEIVRLLAGDETLAEADRARFLELCRLLEAMLHYEFHERLESLKNLYAPFNPDAVTRELHTLSPDQRSVLVPQVFQGLDDLLVKANYRRLSRRDIEQVVGTASEWGLRLHIDFGIFERLEVYARGDVVDQRTRRHWRTWYRPQQVDLPIYQRLVVVFKLQPHPTLRSGEDTNSIYIKIFKNVPKQDVDMLLPGSRFKMSRLDQGKAVLPTLSGIALATTKIVKGALLLPFTGPAGIVAFVGFVGGTIGYGVKSFLGYLRTKDKYQLNLTRSLYYQNLDSNAGVLFRLLDEAEEQEFREAIVAYALLRRRAGDGGWSDGQLDEQAERYLHELLGFDVDFEVHDALDKLARLGCARCDGDGRWRVLPLAEALAQLDQTWDNAFRHHVPETFQPQEKS